MEDIMIFDYRQGKWVRSPGGDFVKAKLREAGKEFLTLEEYRELEPVIEPFESVSKEDFEAMGGEPMTATDLKNLTATGVPEGGDHGEA